MGDDRASKIVPEGAVYTIILLVRRFVSTLEVAEGGHALRMISCEAWFGFAGTWSNLNPSPFVVWIRSPLLFSSLARSRRRDVVCGDQGRFALLL